MSSIFAYCTVKVNSISPFRFGKTTRPLNRWFVVTRFGAGVDINVHLICFDSTVCKSQLTP